MKFLSNKKVYIKGIDVVLMIFPFLLLFVINIIYPLANNFNLKDAKWLLSIACFEYFLIVITLILFLLKYHNYDGYFVWLGMSIFFLYSIYNGYFKFLLASFMGKNIHSIVNATLSFPYHTMEQIFLLLGISVIIILLFVKFKVKLVKLFLLIFSYYFSFCYLRVIFHYAYPIIIDTSVDNIKLFYFLNPLISAIFLLIFKHLKSFVEKALLFGAFLLSNFVALNIFDILEKINDFLLKGEVKLFFTQLYYIIVIYIKYFLVKSNFIYFMLILGILMIHSRYSFKLSKGFVDRQR